jgi:hypothetical protein
MTHTVEQHIPRAGGNSFSAKFLYNLKNELRIFLAFARRVLGSVFRVLTIMYGYVVTSFNAFFEYFLQFKDVQGFLITLCMPLGIYFLVAHVSIFPPTLGLILAGYFLIRYAFLGKFDARSLMVTFSLMFISFWVLVLV